MIRIGAVAVLPARTAGGIIGGALVVLGSVISFSSMFVKLAGDDDDKTVAAGDTEAVETMELVDIQGISEVAEAHQAELAALPEPDRRMESC